MVRAADSRSLLALRRSRKLRRFSSSGMAGMRNCELLSLVHITVKEWSSKTASKLGRGGVGEVRQDPADMLEAQVVDPELVR
jgi:hypothetical protein